MPKEAIDLAVRKKMRKGTHSCFECRRRKIRCIFPPDNPDVCSECFARGSRCVDQEHANPDVVVDHRKNLRERVSRLEALVDSLLEEKSERSVTDTLTDSSKTPNLATQDKFPPTPVSTDASSSVRANIYIEKRRDPSERGHHVPILSVFEDALNDAEERMKARMDVPRRKESLNVPDAAPDRYTVVCSNVDDMGENSTAFNRRKERAKQGLLKTLPPPDQLERIFASNGDWWQTWRRKCSGTSSPEETLSQFAAKALADSNIGALGTVVLSVGICAADEQDVENYIEAVDQYVLADDEYAATLEGMECLILKAKWYADVGQPRRAWISYRKGLMYTQLMGLHRQRTACAAHESIWWALYHGDRFLSLLLGLPYGISDTHCDLTLPETFVNGKYMAPLTFMNKISIVAGKVIDRNQGIAEQSFAWALQLDQELEDLWKQLDPSWLEYSHLLADIENNAAELRERVMAQMVYQQIRVYLHLPFYLKSQSNSRFSYSRTACLNGSREVLRLYQTLRTGEVQPLYECKAVDFIGFTSAVLIMLGLFHCALSGTNTMAPKDQESDVRLIEMSIDIFRRASSEKGGKVALQSAAVLEKMLKKHKIGAGEESDDQGEEGCMADFVIPYFGTISIRRGGTVSKPPASMCGGMVRPNSDSPIHKDSISSATTNSTQFTPTTDTSSSDLFSSLNSASTSTTNTANFNFNQSPMISYDGFYNWPTPPVENAAAPGSTMNTSVNDDSMNNFPLPTNNFSWQNMPMDIDQDWSWFLNDGGNNGGALPVQGTAGTGQAGNQFGPRSYAGFG